MASLYERYRDVLRQGHLPAARGQRVEALQAYEAAARMLPRRVVPRIGIGRMHLALGDLDAARAAFQLALAIEPDHRTLSDGRRMASRPRAWHDGRYSRGWWEPA